MAFPTGQGNNKADFIAQDAKNEAEIWRAGAYMYEQTEDVFSRMEGGADALIETVTDTSRGKGHTVNFRTETGYYGEGKQDNEEFDDSDDFEEDLMNTDSLKVGLLRNATTWWFTTDDELGMSGELHSGKNEKLGEWMGREKTFQMAACATLTTNPDNHVVADGFTVSLIEDTTAMLRPLGGSPAMLHTDANGNKIWGLCYLTTTEGHRALQADPRYDTVLQNARERSASNPLFTGDSVMVRGNLVKHWDVKDHDGEGAVGSHLNPHAYLGVAIATGTANIDIKGGGNATAAAKTKIKFMRFMPRYAFRLVGAGAVSATASTQGLNAAGRFYVTITNPKNAATDPNKWGFYEIATNDGHKLTTYKRLAGTASGDAATTVGGVSWDSAKNTVTHPVGSLITWSDKNGVPLGRTLAMGKAALRRGYGSFRNKRMTQDLEGGARKQLFIASIFGQGVRKDYLKRNPGIIVITHPIGYSGWAHPVPA